MTQKMLIISVENNSIKAVPCEKEECAGCSIGCEKKKAVSEILNPHNLSVKPGDLVTAAASKSSQAIQGIISLFFPFLSSIAGYFCSQPIMSLFGKTISNDAKAVFVLLFLTLSSAIVFIVTRKHPLPGKPVIVDVM